MKRDVWWILEALNAIASQLENVQGLPGVQGPIGPEGPVGPVGPAGPPAFANAVLSSDFTSSLAAIVDIPGLSFTPAPLGIYEFRGILMLRTSVAGSKPRPSVVWPGAEDGVVGLRAANTAAAYVLQFGNLSATVTIPVGALPNTTQSWPCFIEGLLKAGASPIGALRLAIQSETAGVVSTVIAGSFLSWRLL